MENFDTLIKALRCSSLPYSNKTMDCTDCPYRLLEEVDEKLPIPYDIEIDGKQYYESCDCDRMVMDAADVLEMLKEVAEEYKGGWIPIDEKLPPDDNFILLSFSNFSVPIVGRYEEDKDGGGNFFAGDEDEPLISQDLFVNAWMPLPKPYEER